jgi:hypothetical protein
MRLSDYQFLIENCTELVEIGITVPPAMNQIGSVARVHVLEKVLSVLSVAETSSSVQKPLNRNIVLSDDQRLQISQSIPSHLPGIFCGVGPAENLVILAKTSTASRMPEIVH